ncbi:MAG: hypothetical protein ACJ74Z_19275 [Bryobacteraceae bacterium]|jgi:hypothetical protein
MEKTNMKPNGTGKRITVQGMSIKKVTIGVDSLTLSILRQLQKEEVLDYHTGRLKGVPWGWVNYSPGDCVEEAEHIHVIWQKGSEVRRSCVRRKPRIPVSLKSERDWAESLYLAEAVLQGEITDLYVNQRLLLLSNELLGPLVLSCLSCQENLLNYLRNNREGLAQCAKAYEKNVVEASEKLREYTVAYPYKQGSLEQAERAIAEFERTWRESYAAITSEGQIFIAV